MSNINIKLHSEIMTNYFLEYLGGKEVFRTHSIN